MNNFATIFNDTLQPVKRTIVKNSEYMWMQHSIFFTKLSQEPVEYDTELYIPVCPLTTNDFPLFVRTISSIRSTKIPYEFFALFLSERDRYNVIQYQQILHPLSQTHSQLYFFMTRVLRTEHIASELCIMASRYGILECLMFAHKVGYFINIDQCMQTAQKYGNHTCVEYLVDVSNEMTLNKG